MDNGVESGNGTQTITYENPSINWYGLAAVVVFYALILIIGIWASRRKRAVSESESEDVMLAGRNIGFFVGCFTMTATWVGGGYINGTAEYVFKPNYGLIWTQAPIGYAISLFFGGLLFAKKMREAGYVTMLDPFDQRYGKVMAALLYIPALLGEVFWSAAILSALGASLAVILGLDHTTAVIISACVAVFYTMIGGLYSVAFTDVIQLICIFIGLWLGVGFAFTHDAVSNIGDTMNADVETGWIGNIEAGPWVGYYVDSFLLLIFGGIPWQVYFQRVLSSKNVITARTLSFVASFGCIFMAVPAVLIGAIAKSTDWSKTDYAKYRPVPIQKEDYKLVLPMVLQYLCPTAVAVVGLGAVSAAVMSSADSSVLSASAMFARNIYHPIRNAVTSKSASETEIVWVMRISIVFVGAAATFMGIVVDSVYGLWHLCSDLIYCILFPQLVCVVYIPSVNTCGSFAGFIVGMVLRLLGGEPLIMLQPVIEYPWFDEESGKQRFPFKTMIMLISFCTIILVSWLVNFLFKRGVLSQKLEILLCENREHEIVKLDLQAVPETKTKTNEKGSYHNLKDVDV